MIRLDFGYPWWLSYGHIVILLPAILLLVLALRRRWPIWSVVLVSLLVLWSGAGLGIARFVFDPDGVPALPTQNFLRAGKGRFDAIVSAYAIDHLNREGVEQALTEAHRVLKPGGDFLLILIGKDPWGHLAYGPLFAHFGGRKPDWWRSRRQEANFQVSEQGTQPLTLYFLAHRPE